jgi:hypothetical protein
LSGERDECRRSSAVAGTLSFIKGVRPRTTDLPVWSIVKPAVPSLGHAYRPRENILLATIYRQQNVES